MLIELSRKSIAFWGRLKDADPVPISHGEGHDVPLVFRVDDGGVHVGPLAARMLANNERERAHGDYFGLAHSSTKVRLHGTEQPAEVLLFEAAERYAEVFLRDHLRGAEALSASRKDLRLRFAFAPDLDANDRALVIALFNKGGYQDVAAVDMAVAIRQTVQHELSPPSGTPIAWFAAVGNDLFLTYAPAGSGSPTDPQKLVGLGQDPRLGSLVDILFQEATESTRMELNRERETPVLVDAAKHMLAKGGRRLTASITLADGDTVFDASVADTELEERSKWDTSVKQALDALGAMLKKQSVDTHQTICVLSGSAIATPYYAGRLQEQFRQVVCLNGKFEEALRRELFDLASMSGKRTPGFEVGKNVAPSTPDTASPTPSSPPPLPPPAEDPVEKRKREIAEQLARSNKEYDDEVRLGDFEFENGDLRKAVGHFQRAAGIKSQEVYPKERVAAIQREIAEVDERTKGNEEQYNAAITQADTAFKAYKLPEARRKYEEAAKLKPLEPYPKQQLASVASWVEKCAQGNQKWATTFLALFLGGIGAHRFYLGQTGRGVLSMLFFWTGLPLIFGFLNGLNFLLMGNARFLQKYNQGKPRTNKGLLVMTILGLVLAVGLWYLAKRLVGPSAEKLVAQHYAQFIQSGTWILLDDQQGGRAVYEVVFEEPNSKWSIFSPSTVHYTDALNVRVLEGSGAPALPQMFFDVELPLFQESYNRQAIVFCAEGGRGPCFVPTFLSRAEITFQYHQADGYQHTYRGVRADELAQLQKGREYAQYAFLREVDEMMANGDVVRLGKFKAYVCKAACAAAFEEESSGGLWREYVSETDVYGKIRLANTHVSSDGDRTNRSVAGRRFLYATRIISVTDPESGSVVQAHKLIAIMPYKESMNVPALQERLGAAARDDARIPPESGLTHSDASPLAMELVGGAAEPSGLTANGPIPAAEDAVDEPIFSIVEEMPAFPGGETELFKYLGKTVVYPQMAQDAMISGVVYMTFIVEENGKVNDPKVVRGIGGGCDQEAIRVVKSMPVWEPGKQRGKPVRVQYNLPIRFTLK
ncbi:MAG: TonB family protein [Flavobacteriales bacterium]|nr:TonB family protein [Flavobacteriales bacterium]